MESFSVLWRPLQLTLLGSESKFIVPLARPSGPVQRTVMKLASDPNNSDLRSLVQRVYERES